MAHAIVTHRPPSFNRLQEVDDDPTITFLQPGKTLVPSSASQNALDNRTFIRRERLEKEESFSALSEADDTTDLSSGKGESLITATTG